MSIRLSSVNFQVSTISSNVNTNSSNVYTLNLSLNTISTNVYNASISLNTLSSSVYSITTSSTLSLSGNLVVGGTLSVLGNIQSPGTYRCNLTLSTNSTLSGSDLVVEYNRSSDPNSWYANATKRVTPTVAGWYNIFYQVKFNAATSGTGFQWNIQVLRNNVTVAIAQAQMVNDVGRTLATQALLYFNGSTDYLTTQVYASSTTTLNTDPGWSRLELFMI